MATNVDLDELRDRTRFLTDWDSDAAAATTTVTDAVLLRELNASGRLWHGMVVAAVPERYEKAQTITPTGVVKYALPADYYITLGVHYLDSNGQPFPVDRIQYQERHLYDHTKTTTWAQAYYLTDVNIALLPAPATGSNTYQHDYVRTWTDLSLGTDTVDGFSGWEQWIVLDVAVKLRFREDARVQEWMAQRAQIEAEVAKRAQSREAVSPMRIADTRRAKRRRRDPDFWGGR